MAITLTAAKSYWTWGYERGYIKQPLKDPKPEPAPEAVKEPKAPIITRAELAEGVNSNIHKNVVSISKFLKRGKAA